MNTAKRMICLLLTVALMLALMPSVIAAQSGAVDVPSAWTVETGKTNDTDACPDKNCMTVKAKTSYTKGTSDWVLASSAPADAQITDRKWTYTLTSYKTSWASESSGWTQYDSDYEWDSWSSWSTWQDVPFYADESRQVETRTGYFYYYYVCSNCGAHMHATGTCYTWADGCGKNTVSRDSYHSIRSAVSYNSTSDFHDTGINYTNNTADGRAFAYVSPDSQNYFEPIPQYRYRTRDKIWTYYYYKTEEKESSSKPSGSDVSNIKEWVKYSIKSSGHFYYDVVLKYTNTYDQNNAVADYGYDKGKLIDINNDGIKELVIRYQKNNEYIGEIWTMKENEPACIFRDTIGHFAGNGPTGSLFIGKHESKEYLVVSRTYGEENHSYKEWTLYQLEGQNYSKEHLLKAHYIFSSDAKEVPALSPIDAEFFVDGVQVSDKEFLDRTPRTTTQIMNWEKDAEDGSESLLDLKEKLSRNADPCPSANFRDTPDIGVWSHDGIDYCVKRGLMNGIGNGLFDPNGTVSRAQLVTILYRVAGSPAVTTSGTFTDVPAGQWYSKAIEWAAANGVVNGIGDGKFGPDRSITREQIATILYRYENQPAVSGNLSTFPDQGNVSGFAVNAMIWATQEGFITGVSSNGVITLAPQNNATRAQIAAIIMRYLES